MNARDRLELITINGEAVAELDVRASHLTLLYGLTDTPFDPDEDPYYIEGIDRSVVKAWLTRAIGSGTFSRRWSSQAASEWRDVTGTELRITYPVRMGGGETNVPLCWPLVG